VSLHVKDLSSQLQLFICEEFASQNLYYNSNLQYDVNSLDIYKYRDVHIDVQPKVTST
jgi:hypothetical protein